MHQNRECITTCYNTAASVVTYVTFTVVEKS